MGGLGHNNSGIRRHVLMTLAMLALALKVLIPQGFMASAPQSGPGFALELCTDQGMVVIPAGQGLAQKDDPGKPPPGGSHEGPCVFAGHGLDGLSPDGAGLAAFSFITYGQPSPSARSDLAPGLGLAAPPPPSHAPPRLRAG